MDELPSPPEWDLILSASQKNNADEIRRLVENTGVPPSHSNVVGQTALHIASLWGSVDAVETLISLGADLDAQNRLAGATPLHCAVRGTFQAFKETLLRRARCAEMLLSAGADGTICDMKGKDALGYLDDVTDEARLKGVANIQTEMGEMRNILSGAGQPRSELFSFIKEGDVEQANNYLKGEVEQSEKNSGLLFAVEQLTSLVDSSNGESTFKALVEIIQSVLASGADPNMGGVETDGAIALERAPLHVACNSLCNAYATSHTTAKLAAPYLEEIVRDLRNNSATIAAETESILLDASRRGRIAVVQFLVGIVGVDPNVRGRQGMTPLHFSARSGKVDVVQWLLKSTNGLLDSSIVDDAGKQAIHYAAANNKEDIVDLLKSHNN